MLRNNRIFQSLGINALASMVRMRNDVQEGSGITIDDSASGVTEGSSSDYSPKDDEVSDQDESDDTVVKTIKVGMVCVCWGGGGYFVCCVFHVCLKFFGNNFLTLDLMPFFAVYTRN